jgi:hypothetical protein
MQGEDLVTVGLAGTETIINNGLGRINMNDRVWFDPNPCVVTDLDGTKRPAVLIPGLSPTAMYFQTRAYTPLTTVSDILIYQRRCQKLLLAPEMRTKINACRDHHDLYAVTTGVVKRVRWRLSRHRQPDASLPRRVDGHVPRDGRSEWR